MISDKLSVRVSVLRSHFTGWNLLVAFSTTSQTSPVVTN